MVNMRYTLHMWVKVQQILIHSHFPTEKLNEKFDKNVANPYMIKCFEDS